jgi:hypothetical protein
VAAFLFFSCGSAAPQLLLMHKRVRSKRERKRERAVLLPPGAERQRGFAHVRTVALCRSLGKCRPRVRRSTHTPTENRTKKKKKKTGMHIPVAQPGVRSPLCSGRHGGAEGAAARVRCPSFLVARAPHQKATPARARARPSPDDDHPFLSDPRAVAAADAAAGALRTPHAGYHFDGTPRRFFEGWYWKVRCEGEERRERQGRRVRQGRKKGKMFVLLQQKQNKTKQNKTMHRSTCPARPAPPLP